MNHNFVFANNRSYIRLEFSNKEGFLLSNSNKVNNLYNDYIRSITTDSDINQFFNNKLFNILDLRFKELECYNNKAFFSFFMINIGLGYYYNNYLRLGGSLGSVFNIKYSLIESIKFNFSKNMIFIDEASILLNYLEKNLFDIKKIDNIINSFQKDGHNFQSISAIKNYIMLVDKDLFSARLDYINFSQIKKRSYSALMNLEYDFLRIGLAKNNIGFRSLVGIGFGLSLNNSYLDVPNNKRNELLDAATAMDNIDKILIGYNNVDSKIRIYAGQDNLTIKQEKDKLLLAPAFKVYVGFVTTIIKNCNFEIIASYCNNGKSDVVEKGVDGEWYISNMSITHDFFGLSFAIRVDI